MGSVILVAPITVFIEKVIRNSSTLFLLFVVDGQQVADEELESEDEKKETYATLQTQNWCFDNRSLFKVFFVCEEVVLVLVI